MTEYVSAVTRVVISPIGVSALFIAGKPRGLRESMVLLALSQGVTVVGETEVIKDTAPALETVVAGIRELMATGDSKAFSSTSGQPNLTQLRKVAGAGVTDALRDAAWDLVKAETAEE